MLDVAPTPGHLRTAAMCLTALVPFLVGLLTLGRGTMVDVRESRATRWNADTGWTARSRWDLALIPIGGTGDHLDREHSGSGKRLPWSRPLFVLSSSL